MERDHPTVRRRLGFLQVQAAPNGQAPEAPEEGKRRRDGWLTRGKGRRLWRAENAGNPPSRPGVHTHLLPAPYVIVTHQSL